MQKLVTVLIGTSTLLVGCAPEPQGVSDWRMDGGCEKYFTVTSREFADCNAFVKSQEDKNKPGAMSGRTAPGQGGVSLDPIGAYKKETQGEKQNLDTERTLTN